jgi:hypothetical protein
MPDLITHFALNHLIKRFLELKTGSFSSIRIRTFFYLGTILPDVLTRPLYIAFSVNQDWTVAIHTPLGLGLISIVISLFIEPGIRKRAFINLISGGILHLILDSFQQQVTGNNFWLFPFSYHNFGFNIFRAGDLIPFTPLWIVIIVILELWIYYLGKKRLKKDG